LGGRFGLGLCDGGPPPERKKKKPGGKWHFPFVFVFRQGGAFTSETKGGKTKPAGTPGALPSKKTKKTLNTGPEINEPPPTVFSRWFLLEFLASLGPRGSWGPEKKKNLSQKKNNHGKQRKKGAFADPLPAGGVFSFCLGNELPKTPNCRN